MSSIISASLSPNTEPDDVWLAFRQLLTPWTWKRGTAAGKAESWFRENFGSACSVSFNSGRSALLGLLRAFQIGKGDEVIVQAFTCVAVPNSVLWAGAHPVYADIDETFNISLQDLLHKISKKTKAVIIQHTFGKPAKTDEILSIARKYNLLVIEDCAHALGAEYKGKKIGTCGDAAFFSFGRDKVISSVFGGLAIIHQGHPLPCKRLKEYHKNLINPSYGWIFRQVFHPVAFSVILPLYRVGIGKLLLVIFQRLRLLGFPVYREEKKGRQPHDYPAKFPNVLAVLLLKQLKKLDKFTRQRLEVSRFYGEDIAYVRFPKTVDDPKATIETAKKRGILLGNWYHNIIDPAGVDFEKICYTKGSCPNAEQAAKHMINLPTRISLSDAKKVLTVL